MFSNSTVRRFALVLGLGIALSGLTACPGGGDDADAVTAGCERLDECNALRPGLSANECIEEVDVSLQGATPSERSDWETLMEGCLEFETCGAFISCVDANGL
ncbi:MAG TPA: hypothetical protein VNO33_02460 [Kofleriaceae bacterium]|nr:hypothetical protein [Kofleriaceae bacterium]